MNRLEELAKKAKASSYALSVMDNADKNKIILSISECILANTDEVLKANSIDMENLKSKSPSMADRLRLTPERLASMCDGLSQIVQLDDPIGQVVDKWTNASGLEISKVRASLGVIGVIYEARPNVTIDVAGLCIKTGNAVILRGGSDAINSNRALYNIMSNAIEQAGFCKDIVQFIDDTDRSLTLDMLKLGKYIDVVIPRGGDALKNLVLANATMPVIASAGGNCHLYVDSSADIDMAIDVIINAKAQRPSVCNSLEQLLISREILDVAVPKIFTALKNAGVVIKACSECIDSYNKSGLVSEECVMFCAGDGSDECTMYCGGVELATKEDYYEEHLSLMISVKAVADVSEAIERINEHSTCHSEAIIATDQNAINMFTAKVDSGCVYVNASTRFTDGFEFGFGAEIGISTQKLHARGPLGLAQLTSEKYVCVGNGTIRK